MIFMNRHRATRARTGGVYIVVLGTALMVSILGMSSLVLQRIQNRHLSATEEMRQAQLNAETAIELGMLIFQDESNWRTARTNGRWFTARNTGAGTCTLDVVDPIDANLADDDKEPIVLLGIGNRGKAEQRIEVTVDPVKTPINCLKSTVAAGDLIDMQSDTLRASDLVTANQVTSNASNIYGTVKAVTVSGSTYHGTSTAIGASELPEMPAWQTAFDYFRTNATAINISDLPTLTPNMGRNTGIEGIVTEWTGNPPWTLLEDSDISQNNSFKHGGSYSLRVQNRDQWYSGAAQRVDDFVKAGVQYNVEVWIYQDEGASRSFRLTLVTKGSASGVPLFESGPAVAVPFGSANSGWTKVSATLTAQPWSGNLDYAFVLVAGADTVSDDEFYLDNLVIRENVSGRFIYRQLLSPGVNPFGSGTTNAQGIYKIDCGGQRVVIERSRISGTLLLINPGANSCVGDGPIHWAPYVAGYPALLVEADTAADADFSIRATNRSLNEKENGVNYNPSGSSHADFGQDSDTTDIYRSQITGLIAIEDDLTFQNTPLIRGQIIVGDDIANCSGALDVEFQPDSLLNPPPGFLAPNSYRRRAGSATKAVLP
jgi:hypothetical protein